MKVINSMNNGVDFVDVVCIAGLVAGCLWISGCGYALVKVPDQAGTRIYMGAEQRIDAAFETAMEAVETGVNPASYFRSRKNQ